MERLPGGGAELEGFAVVWLYKDVQELALLAREILQGLILERKQEIVGIPTGELSHHTAKRNLEISFWPARCAWRMAKRRRRHKVASHHHLRHNLH